MSDLTREEIERACDFAGLLGESGDPEEWTHGSAFALLEATGERWQCGRSIGHEEPFFVLIPGQGHVFSHDLRIAAVRAVNCWADLARSGGRQEGP